VSKEDPKPGRWILPVVIVALIGFTYLFVNALPPAAIPVGTTTTVVASDTTTTVPVEETTTTTLPPELAEFMKLVDGFADTANSIAADINATNEAWENREGDTPSFVDTLHAFEASKEDAQTLSDEVAAATPPDVYAEVWPDAVSTAATLPSGINAIIEGLRAPDDGTARREAVEAYKALNDLFLQALDQVRAATP